jgi:RND family efflux transporter MFP subunit
VQGVCLVLAVLVLAGCEQEVAKKAPAARLVNTMRVADTTGLMERSFAGRASAGQEVNLSFRVSGPLLAFPVDVGDEVKEGDLAARMDPADFETALRTVQGQLEREQAVVTRAQADLARLEKIMREDAGATSQAAIDRARQARDSARAGARSVQAAVQTAKDQLRYTELRAPFDGVIVETYVDNFETVVAKQPVLRLLDPSSIEFLISVPEGLIGLAPYVEQVLVEFDALPGVKVPAQVKEIGREATQATRTYPVTLLMAQPSDGEILPGMAGKANIVGRPPEDSDEVGLEVPATAVFKGDDAEKSYVWVVDETSKTLSRREVQVGGLSRFGMRVTAGLKPGELIVTKGVHSVADGQQVRIMKTSS